MKKGEHKEYNKALTYHYLIEQDNGAEVAEQMGIRLETALTKDDNSFVMSAVSSNDHNNDTTEKIESLCTVTTSKVGRTYYFHFFTSQNRPKESGSHLFLNRSKGANSEWMAVSKENDTNVGGPCGRLDCRSST
jgi:hypothetical protein